MYVFICVDIRKMKVKKEPSLSINIKQTIFAAITVNIANYSRFGYGFF